jgi:cytochrome c556
MKLKYWTKILLLVCTFMVSHADSEQQPALHGIYSEKLKTIMLRMNQLVYEREMTALQVQEVREQHLQQLINTVSELVKASEVLTDAIPGIELSTEDQVIFRAMANQLYREAQNIGIMVEEKDYSALDSAYQRLNETCNACHGLFRF